MQIFFLRMLLHLLEDNNNERGWSKIWKETIKLPFYDGKTFNLCNLKSLKHVKCMLGYKMISYYLLNLNIKQDFTCVWPAMWRKFFILIEFRIKCLNAWDEYCPRIYGFSKYSRNTDALIYWKTNKYIFQHIEISSF